MKTMPTIASDTSSVVPRSGLLNTERPTMSTLISTSSPKMPTVPSAFMTPVIWSRRNGWGRP